MALPAFVEIVDTGFLRPSPEPARQLPESLDRREGELRMMTDRLAVYEATQSIFLAMMEAQLPTLNEADIDQALREMLDAETHFEQRALPRLREIEQERLHLAEGAGAVLDLLAREEEALRRALRVSRAGRESALTLKDRLLVLEGERMSAASFWADDDE
jgi:hypothetical protein